MLIDSHAHIFYEDYREDLNEVLQRAVDAGVEAIVVPGTTLETSRQAVDLANRYPAIYAAVGFHPHDASQANDNALVELEALCKDPRVVAIGEIGLDYHYDLAPRDTQLNIFRKQIQIAIRQELPIIVHTRESIPDSIDCVEEAVGKQPEWRAVLEDSTLQPAVPRGVFHCFTGSPEDVRRLNALGFYCSYPGIVTFKNSPVLETLKQTGFEHILIETDSPYLTPVPFRGRRNEPARVGLISKKLADLFGVSEVDIARATTANAIRLFGLPASASSRD